jgi:uncharacterized SAM-binding protein YcdF (DUF218 family)
MRVIAVLGYSRGARSTLHPVARRRLEHAQRLADGAGAVILSGWARRRAPAAEAELMRAAWRRPDVPVVLDHTARSTAGNAAAVGRLARELRASEVVVVTSRWHAPRAGALVRAALRGTGIAVTVASPGGLHEPWLAVRELVCATALPLQTRRLRQRVAEPLGYPCP